MIFIGAILYCIDQWFEQFEGDFRSEKLTSSKGENIYVNVITWGNNGYNQITAISTDRTKLKEEDLEDTTNCVYGLNPFAYRFKNDTLTLFFKEKVTYKIHEKFNTIVVESIPFPSGRDNLEKTQPDIKYP